MQRRRESNYKFLSQRRCIVPAYSTPGTARNQAVRILLKKRGECDHSSGMWGPRLSDPYGMLSSVTRALLTLLSRAQGLNTTAGAGSSELLPMAVRRRVGLPRDVTGRRRYWERGCSTKAQGRQ